MLERVIQWSIDNRVFVSLAALFIAAAGILALGRAQIDAIPDLSDVQVIVYTEYLGQAPRIVEEQVTYPLTTQLLAAPFASAVRGYSFFGYSFVHVIFEDGTDPYWARARVLEYLNHAAGRLPPGVTPTLGPDATGVGWAFMYALTSDRHDLGELRSIQDWYLKYELTAVPGVAEVASVGGFVRQYQITVDPDQLRAHGVPIARIRAAVQASNSDVGARSLEIAEKEFMIRGLGYIQSLDDIRKIALGTDDRGMPILLRDVAQVRMGPEMRRGIAELDGEGEAVGGIVVVRHGADTRQVIRDVKARLAEVEAGLPDGVEVRVAYDRTGLIEGGHRQPDGQPRAATGHRRADLPRLPAARQKRPGGRDQPAGGHPDRVHRHGPAGAHRQHHVARRHCGCDRHHGGCRHRDGGERPPAPCRRPGPVPALAGHHRIGPGSGAVAVFRAPGDRRVVPARVCPGSAGRQALQAARLHQDLCHGCRGPARADPDPGTGGLPGAWAVVVRPAQPGEPLLQLAVPARSRAGAQIQGRRAVRGGVGAGRHRGAVRPARHGIHAVAVGRRPALHADHLPGHLHHQGAGTAAADRPHHRRFPGGGPGIRESRPRRDGHRSGPPCP